MVVSDTSVGSGSDQRAHECSIEITGLRLFPSRATLYILEADGCDRDWKKAMEDDSASEGIMICPVCNGEPVPPGFRGKMRDVRQRASTAFSLRQGGVMPDLKHLDT